MFRQNRQRADAFACKGKDNICHCRGDWRDSRLSHPGGRLVIWHYTNYYCQHFLHSQHRVAVKRRSLAIGLPSGVTYFLLAFNMLITYRVLGPYGTAALATVGIGFRILQSIYLPVVALTSAMAAVVAQNMGARRPLRVHRTLWTGWIISSGIMVLGTLLCLAFPAFLMGIFNDDPQVIAYGTTYLTVMGLGTVVVGTIMSVSAVFQGIGKTYPTLLAAPLDSGLFAAMVFTLPGIFGWGIEAGWWIKLATGIIEMVFCALWLRWELKRSGLNMSLSETQLKTS